MSGEVYGDRHAWQLVAPWWAWPTADDPLTGRGTRPLLQKFAADEFVEGFLKKPQHSLRFDESADRVSAVTLVNQALPPAVGQAIALAELTKHSRDVRLVSTGVRKLYLPLHARHYLVSCELHCDAREFPSVDPAAVCGAGFVVRRLSAPVPVAAERELFQLQQQREQAAAELNELLLRGPLREHLSWLRRRRIEQLEARGELPAARDQARAALARAEAQLATWRAQHGIAQQVEAWHASESDPDVGEWRVLSPEQQLAGDPAEHSFPLRRLHAPPTEPGHDAAGRTIFFGSVPTTHAQRDRYGRPRFDDRSLYEIRCFVTRRKPACQRPRGFAGCRGARVWSLGSEPYRLASPMDALGCANRPVTLRMPDLAELLAHAVARPRGALSNVRVVHQQQIAPKGLDAPPAAPTGPAICHVSIPLITIVAMFVLNIFLPIVVVLFQLWWLLAFRFCIPPAVKANGALSLAADLTNALPPSGDFSAGLRVNGVDLDADAVRGKLTAALDDAWTADDPAKMAGKAAALNDDVALARDARNASDNVQRPPLELDAQGRPIEPPLQLDLEGRPVESPAASDYLDVPEPKRRRSLEPRTA